MRRVRYSEERKRRQSSDVRFGEQEPRAVDATKPPDTFLIVCEGEKTEPNYFKGFKLPSADVQVIGLGANTTNLVEKAIKLKNEKFPDKQQYWCVFDRDSFPAQNFNAALDNAKKNGFRVAYSNEAFELWYLLHFNYYDAALSRAAYPDKLSALLRFKYTKNSNTIYNVLEDKQDTAIKNARKLLVSYGAAHNPETDNPSTTVHLLVEQLIAQL